VEADRACLDCLKFLFFCHESLEYGVRRSVLQFAPINLFPALRRFLAVNHLYAAYRSAYLPIDSQSASVNSLFTFARRTHHQISSGNHSAFGNHVPAAIIEFSPITAPFK